eukprot:3912414-Alexandrium_andersonii.AAC.1
MPGRFSLDRRGPFHASDRRPARRLLRGLGRLLHEHVGEVDRRGVERLATVGLVVRNDRRGDARP